MELDCTQRLDECLDETFIGDVERKIEVAILEINTVKYPLYIGENRIGRDRQTCSICIDNKVLSKQHAVLELGRSSDEDLIYDLGSSNKTRLGKLLLKPHVHYQLRNNANIMFGNLSSTFCRFPILEEGIAGDSEESSANLKSGKNTVNINGVEYDIHDAPTQCEAEIDSVLEKTNNSTRMESDICERNMYELETQINFEEHLDTVEKTHEEIPANKDDLYVGNLVIDTNYRKEVSCIKLGDTENGLRGDGSKSELVSINTSAKALKNISDVDELHLCEKLGTSIINEDSHDRSLLEGDEEMFELSMNCPPKDSVAVISPQIRSDVLCDYSKQTSKSVSTTEALGMSGIQSIIKSDLSGDETDPEDLFIPLKCNLNNASEDASCETSVMKPESIKDKVMLGAESENGDTSLDTSDIFCAPTQKISIEDINKNVDILKEREGISEENVDNSMLAETPQKDCSKGSEKVNVEDVDLYSAQTQIYDSQMFKTPLKCNMNNVSKVANCETHEHKSKSIINDNSLLVAESENSDTSLDTSDSFSAPTRKVIIEETPVLKDSQEISEKRVRSVDNSVLADAEDCYTASDTSEIFIAQTQEISIKKTNKVGRGNTKKDNVMEEKYCGDLDTPFKKLGTRIINADTRDRSSLESDEDMFEISMNCSRKDSIDVISTQIRSDELGNYSKRASKSVSSTEALDMSGIQPITKSDLSGDETDPEDLFIPLKCNMNNVSEVATCEIGESKSDSIEHVSPKIMKDSLLLAAENQIGTTAQKILVVETPIIQERQEIPEKHVKIVGNCVVADSCTASDSSDIYIAQTQKISIKTNEVVGGNTEKDNVIEKEYCGDLNTTLRERSTEKLVSSSNSDDYDDIFSAPTQKISELRDENKDKITRVFENERASSQNGECVVSDNLRIDIKRNRDCIINGKETFTGNKAKTSVGKGEEGNSDNDISDISLAPTQIVKHNFPSSTEMDGDYNTVRCDDKVISSSANLEEKEIDKLGDLAHSVCSKHIERITVNTEINSSLGKDLSSQVKPLQSNYIGHEDMLTDVSTGSGSSLELPSSLECSSASKELRTAEKKSISKDEISRNKNQVVLKSSRKRKVVITNEEEKKEEKTPRSNKLKTCGNNSLHHSNPHKPNDMLETDITNVTVNDTPTPQKEKPVLEYKEFEQCGQMSQIRSTRLYRQCRISSEKVPSHCDSENMESCNVTPRIKKPAPFLGTVNDLFQEIVTGPQNSQVNNEGKLTDDKEKSEKFNKITTLPRNNLNEIDNECKNAKLPANKSGKRKTRSDKQDLTELDPTTKDTGQLTNYHDYETSKSQNKELTSNVAATKGSRRRTSVAQNSNKNEKCSKTNLTKLADAEESPTTLKKNTSNNRRHVEMLLNDPTGDELSSECSSGSKVLRSAQKNAEGNKSQVVLKMSRKCEEVVTNEEECSTEKKERKMSIRSRRISLTQNSGRKNQSSETNLTKFPDAEESPTTLKKNTSKESYNGRHEDMLLNVSTGVESSLECSSGSKELSTDQKNANTEGRISRNKSQEPLTKSRKRKELVTVEGECSAEKKEKKMPIRRSRISVAQNSSKNEQSSENTLTKYAGVEESHTTRKKNQSKERNNRGHEEILLNVSTGSDSKVKSASPLECSSVSLELTSAQKHSNTEGKALRSKSQEVLKNSRKCKEIATNEVECFAEKKEKKMPIRSSRISVAQNSSKNEQSSENTLTKYAGVEESRTTRKKNQSKERNNRGHEEILLNVSTGSDSKVKSASPLECLSVSLELTTAQKHNNTEGKVLRSKSQEVLNNSRKRKELVTAEGECSAEKKEKKMPIRSSRISVAQNSRKNEQSSENTLINVVEEQSTTSKKNKSRRKNIQEEMLGTVTSEMKIDTICNKNIGGENIISSRSRRNNLVVNHSINSKQSCNMNTEPADSAEESCQQITPKKRRRTTVSVPEEGISKSDSALNILSPSRRSSTRLDWHIMFSKYENSALESAIKRLGGKVTEEPKECTVLVTDKVRRTYKVLCAIGQGKPIVKPEWLQDSQKAKKFLDPWDYLLVDEEAEEKFQFSLKKSLMLARQNKFLSKYTIFSTPKVLPPPEEMKGIIEISGGKYLKKVTGELPEKSFIISCEADKSSWKKLRQHKRPLVSVEVLLLGVLQQHLDLEAHIL